MKRLIWKLPEYLTAQGIKRHDVMQQLGNTKGRVAYSWSDLPKRLDTTALENVIEALETLSGQDVSISDILEYETIPEIAEETQSWQAAELASLEPYDWGDQDPTTLGEALRYIPGTGWVQGD